VSSSGEVRVVSSNNEVVVNESSSSNKIVNK
jgi:hypothetical protein